MTARILLLVTIVSCFAQLQICLSAAANLLKNGDFEQHKNGVPLNWCEGSCCTCQKQTVVTNEKVSGVRSVLVSNRKANWAGISQTLSPPGGLAGKEFGVKASVRLPCDASSMEAQVMATWTVAGKKMYMSLATINAAPCKWQAAHELFRFPSDTPSSVRVYVQTEAKKSAVDFYFDKFSIELYNAPSNWKSRVNAEIERNRKRDISIVVSGLPTRDVTGVTELKQLDFPLGTAVKHNLVTNPKYRQVFLDNFDMAVVTNDMKWRQNEWTRGKLKYQKADEIMEVLEKENIPVRGHTIFWAVPDRNPDWTKSLSALQLQKELEKRVQSVVSRYRGRLVHWDVNNEMLHGRFYRDRLRNETAPSWMFSQARQYDPNVKLFLNDYDITTQGHLIEPYLNQAAFIKSHGGEVQGLGIQSHYKHEDVADYDLLRARIDRLAAPGIPIWFTEVDTAHSDPSNRAHKLEVVARTAFSHPAVHGLLLWGFWAGDQGHTKALWAQDWKITDAGKLWQQLRKEWTTKYTFGPADISSISGGRKQLAFRGFKGLYSIRIGGKTASFRASNGQGKQVVHLDFNQDFMKVDSSVPTQVPVVG